MDKKSEAEGKRQGCPVLTRSHNSRRRGELWFMTLWATLGLSVFIPKPDTRPKGCVDRLMCLQRNLRPRSLSLLFLLCTMRLPRHLLYSLLVTAVAQKYQKTFCYIFSCWTIRLQIEMRLDGAGHRQVFLADIWGLNWSRWPFALEPSQVGVGFALT